MLPVVKVPTLFGEQNSSYLVSYNLYGLHAAISMQVIRARTVGIGETAARYNDQSSFALGEFVDHWSMIVAFNSSIEQGSVGSGYRSINRVTMSSSPAWNSASCYMSLLADHSNWSSVLVRIFTSVCIALVYGAR